ncbi:hypothetical protein [Ralstonia pseudosolanacearum]|nr:hypothetical protein [Ralstonia pseudosolanacearum]MDO3509915.1 hypothetical protein [Ralstonia pseudosolanacearum]MDO3524839.1 hypothetical protein [Ralstonia pseudosolanacearum]MDO3547341.1 hypothetical protein [Ralstonia pseudosolanacearum]MDO3554942.1 hypothetical protein [Ralstonia pseudosolanacearum]MDO3564631.1 hypothetical protein [Ralstonia pseudosolanacearum]
MSNEVCVASLHEPDQVKTSGFEAVDESVHMIDWLRRGRDFRSFVTHDVEHELYSQDQAAQLLELHCEAPPTLETKVRRDLAANKGIVTYFSVTFHISLRVQAGDGRVWRLRVQHNYQASGLDVSGKFQLKLNFTVDESDLEE